MRTDRLIPALNLLLLVALALLVLRPTCGPLRLHDPKAAPRNVAPRGSLADDEASTIALFERASKSVVNISTKERRVLRNLWQSDVFDVPKGEGSGFVWSEDGYIVNEVVPALIARGVPDRPMLGIQMVPDELARGAGIEGVVVDDVVAGGGAEAAGIRPPRQTSAGWLYDVIVGIDGERVRVQKDLLRALQDRADGEEVVLDVLREGRVARVTVRLERPR